LTRIANQFGSLGYRLATKSEITQIGGDISYRYVYGAADEDGKPSLFTFDGKLSPSQVAVCAITKKPADVPMVETGEYHLTE